MARMTTTDADLRLASLAAAIAEPARARMLCSLLDGHARTATELAAVAEVAASTASVHLARLREQKLVDVLSQGRHRYFRLAGPEVASVTVATTCAPAWFSEKVGAGSAHASAGGAMSILTVAETTVPALAMLSTLAA